MTPEEARKYFTEHREEAQQMFDALGLLLRIGDIEALIDFTTDYNKVELQSETAATITTVAQRITEPPFDGKPCPACPSIFRGLHATAHNAVGAFEAAAKGQGDWSRAYRKMAQLKEVVDEYQPLVDKHFEDPKHSHGWTA